MLTEEQLREIEAAERAATVGPWACIGHELYYGNGRAGCIHQQIPRTEDAFFTASARTWVPQLLAMVRELQRENLQLNAALGEADNDIVGLREQIRRLRGQKESHDG
jgi:hypothetical protein